MKPINNWNDVKPMTSIEKLVAGGYVCKILEAKEVTFTSKEGSTFDKLEVSFDIVEGEFKDYYTNMYKSINDENKKWKGKIYLYSPTGDGSDNDEMSARRLKTMTDAIEDSNSGYTWDWDEKKLKGKLVGIIFRNKEYDYEGKIGFFAEPITFASVENIRSGNFKIPKDKYLNGNSPSASTTNNKPAELEEIIDDDLPFN